MADVKKLLEKAQGSYEKSKELAKTMTDKVPEGEHPVKLVKAQAKIFDSGNFGIARHHVISDGDLKGAPIYDNMVVTADNPELGFAHIRAWLETVGVTLPKKASDIEKLLADMSKKGYEAKARVTHQKNSDFVNIKILELLGEGDEAEAEGEVEETEAEGEGEEVDLEAMDRKALKELIKTQGLSIIVNTKMSDDDIRAKIGEAFGAEPEAEAEAEGDDETITAVKEFCAAQDIEVEDADDLAALKEKISGFNYQRDTLTETEIATLESVELGNLIVEAPKPKKTEVKKTVKLKAKK